MRITVNAESHTLEPGTTVCSLLERLGLSGKPCAVEVNRTLVRRAQHETHELSDGDTVELVTLVGGG